MKIKLISTLVLTLIVAATIFISEFGAASANESNRLISTPAAAASIISTEFATIQWRTMVNNGYKIPGSDLNFSSYGQPSVNNNGLVVFRARSTGGGGMGSGGNRKTGIYAKQFGGGLVYTVADLDTQVPYPNNLGTEFTEFPAIPRISLNTANIATRGNHQPVYNYFLPDGTETRAGTTGIYAKLSISQLMTGASKLGAVPGFETYAVPNITPRIMFDVFPGAPSITDDGTIFFKGNYTENGVGKTGVYFRRMIRTAGGGPFPVQLIANSDTVIPNLPPAVEGITFGSTAPPTAVGNRVFFVGLDNEDDPSYGGIYMAPAQPSPTLTTVVGIGQTPINLPVGAITRLGEALSFDGRYLAFWGAWGTETKTVRLYCPEDGNKDLLAFCNGGDPLSMFDDAAGKWYQEKQVPVNQGIFAYDVLTNRFFLAASSDTFNDFIFWGYSGRPPGVGHADEDGEPPRWRGASFICISGGIVAFKARTGALNAQNVYVNPVDGIYLSDITQKSIMQTVLETGMDGTAIDPSLVPGEWSVTGLGIERDGFRGKYLAITASMTTTAVEEEEEEVEDWGGIYEADVRRKQNLPTPR